MDRLEPYTLQTELTDYIPIPRQLLALGLPSTALLIYGALLDRGTLSQKNAYADEAGRVYVCYAIDSLGENLKLSQSIIKKHLKLLEERGLIRRHRQGRMQPSHIFLRLPGESVMDPQRRRNEPGDGSKMGPVRGNKVTPNNRREQQKKNNIYQPIEGESL